MALVDKDIERYVNEVTQEVEPVFEMLREETYRDISNPGMQVGRVEGIFLRMLVAISGARRILELGTFTGYSALMMASVLPDDGILFTLDNNEEHLSIARRYFSMVEYGKKIRPVLGNALDSLRELEGPFDLVFIDADKENYLSYYEMAMERLQNGGLIVVDNALSGGAVIHPSDERARVTDKLNRIVAKDERVENVLLTVRDGIMIARKK
jgi:caffeoyl-CoA O-methyltransferase